MRSGVGLCRVLPGTSSICSGGEVQVLLGRTQGRHCVTEPAALQESSSHGRPYSALFEARCQGGARDLTGVQGPENRSHCW